MFYGVKKMNRKAIVLFTIMMMVMNSIVFIYGDRLLKVEMSVYVLQLGRYQKKQNSDQMIKQLNKVYDGQVIEDRGVCAFCNYPEDNDCIICNGGVFDFVKP